MSPNVNLRHCCHVFGRHEKALFHDDRLSALATSAGSSHRRDVRQARHNTNRSNESYSDLQLGIVNPEIKMQCVIKYLYLSYYFSTDDGMKEMLATLRSKNTSFFKCIIHCTRLRLKQTSIVSLNRALLVLLSTNRLDNHDRDPRFKMFRFATRSRERRKKFLKMWKIHTSIKNETFGTKTQSSIHSLVTL